MGKAKVAHCCGKGGTGFVFSLKYWPEQGPYGGGQGVWRIYRRRLEVLDLSSLGHVDRSGGLERRRITPCFLFCKHTEIMSSMAGASASFFFSSKNGSPSRVMMLCVKQTGIFLLPVIFLKRSVNAVRSFESPV